MADRISDSLEQGLDSGINAAAAAKGAYDAAQGIGAAASSQAGAAASSTAASGAGGAAGAGAAAGTAAGGPAGTVMGYVAGLAAGLLAAPAAKALIVLLAFILMVFCSLPSMFWESPVDVLDNTGPETVYRQYKGYICDKYADNLQSQKDAIEDDFERRMDSDEFEDYDRVEFSFSFQPSEAVLLAESEESAILIVALYEIREDDWRTATFADFKRSVDGVSWWSGLLSRSLLEEEKETAREDGERVLHVHQLWKLEDTGVASFRQKFGITGEKEYIKAAEMAVNLKIYFEGYEGVWSTPGNSSGGIYPGGGTNYTIRQALDALEPVEFFGGDIILPVSGNWYISSPFGWRNYAPDPYHTGIDFAGNGIHGRAVKSVMDGTVLLILDSGNSGFGKHVVVYHGGGVTTMYAHLSSYGAYKAGDSVRAGAVIGYVGSTGLSTGSHLHYEYQIDAKAHDPADYLPL